MKNYKVDLDKLATGLTKLTGRDMVEVEFNERRAGNNNADISFTKSFQARLAARALKEDYNVILALPLYEYEQICTVVFVFLQAGPEKTASLVATQSDASTAPLQLNSGSTEQ